MALILTIAAGISALAGVSVLAALIRRRFGVHDAQPTSTDQRISEAEILTRTGGPFV